MYRCQTPCHRGGSSGCLSGVAGCPCHVSGLLIVHLAPPTADMCFLYGPGGRRSSHNSCPLSTSPLVIHQREV